MRLECQIISTYFTEPSPERAEERIEQVYNENFSELFELLDEVRQWTPLLLVAAGGHREYTRDHDLSQSLGQDESKLLSHIARYIVTYLEENTGHCMVGVERLVRTAKMPKTRNSGRTIRYDDYMYSCISRDNASLVEEFMLTATFQGNFFVLTKLAPYDLDIQFIHELCVFWADNCRHVILSACDDDNYLVLSRK